MAEPKDIIGIVKELQKLEAKAGGKLWKTYQNPMRSDGVFVGEAISDTIEQVNANHRDSWGIGIQLEKDKAELIVGLRNHFPAIAQALFISVSALEKINDTNSIQSWTKRGIAIHAEAALDRIRALSEDSQQAE